MTTYIEKFLLSAQDTGYKKFQASLIPNVDPNCIIGVRTPILRTYAKHLIHDVERASQFMYSLPHRYYEENNLHAFLIEQITDFDKCIVEINHFLPYIDNWATCDSLRPKCFQKHRTELKSYLNQWLSAEHTYTIRFGIEVLLVHYLGEYFEKWMPDRIANIRSEDYYVNMMISWYFATALATQWEVIFPYITQDNLPVWIHNKTIQKAIESHRIPEDHKSILRIYRRNE